MRYLIPVDSSETSCRAAAFAAELARATRAELLLVHVYDAPSAAAVGFMANSPGLDDERAKAAQGAFECAKQAMGTCEVKEHLVELGQPAERIIALAGERGVDLIVMGSRGLSPIKELLLGSVSERVLRGAPCAVTIVR